MKSKTITNTYLLVAATILTMALALPAAAQPVSMTFSGTAANSSITNLLQPNSSNAEYHLAGKGPLGAFTLRLVNAEPNSFSPTPPASCSGPTKAYSPVDTGAGVFRFQDGSLLYVQVTPGGSDCIDFAAGKALCIRNLQITGGTGSFKNAWGTLTLTETVVPVLADISGLPVLFGASGGVKGTISGATAQQDNDQ
jgi:hypothetical protein